MKLNLYYLKDVIFVQCCIYIVILYNEGDLGCVWGGDGRERTAPVPHTYKNERVGKRRYV